MKRFLSALILILILISACSCTRKDSAPSWQEQYDLGVRYLSEGNYEEAIIAFTAAIEIDAKRPEAFLGRGQAYEGAAKALIIDGNEMPQEAKELLDLALDDYLTVIDIDNSSIDAYVYAADVYIMLDDADAAVALLQKCIKLNETDPSAYIGLANVYVLLDEYDNALKILDKGLQTTGDGAIADMAGELRSIDSAEYQILRQDHSYRNESGGTLIKMYYDQVVLSGDNPKLQNINKLIGQDYEKYLHDYQGYFENGEDLKRILGGPFLPTPEAPFYNTFDAAVAYNDNGVFSIAVLKNWMMGGVHNQIPYGLNYDLRTGKTLALWEVLGTDEEHLLSYFKGVVNRYCVDISQKMINGAHNKLDNYTLQDFPYYISAEGEVTLCIPVYELTYGAEGSPVIPTALFLDETVDQAISFNIKYADFYVAEKKDNYSFYLHLFDLTDHNTYSFGAAFPYSEYMYINEGEYSLTDDIITFQVGENEVRYLFTTLGDAIQLKQMDDEGLADYYEKGTIITMFPTEF